MQEQIILILCGIAGVIFHCMAKLKGLLEDARVANHHFNWIQDYVIKDAVSIGMSFLSVGIWFLIFGEAAKAYPKIEAFSRVSFVAMGGLGSYALQLAFGRAKKVIRTVVDKKTDIADNKISRR